jgi:lysozyme family protein
VLDFQRSVDFVIDELEGGGKIATDSGGVSRWGISSKAHPEVDVVTLTREGAIEIFEGKYWIPSGCQNLTWPVNLVIFDCAVHQGVAVAVQISENTVDHLEALLERMERYAHIAEVNLSERSYLRGWINRLVKLKHRCNSA